MQFIEHRGISVRKFDLSIGASNGYTLRMKKNKASVGSDMLEKISKVYPSINTEWLITGKGYMLSDQLDIKINPEIFHHLNENNLQEKIEEKINEKRKKELRLILTEIALEQQYTKSDRVN